MALPQNKPWSAVRKELKRCFSDQISLGHTASQLENMTQKPNEPLRLYIYRYSKLHKAVTQKDAAQDTDPSRWFRFLTSITNTAASIKFYDINLEDDQQLVHVTLSNLPDLEEQLIHLWTEVRSLLRYYHIDDHAAELASIDTFYHNLAYDQLMQAHFMF